MKSLQKYLLGLSLCASILSASLAQAKNFCSMTLNSSDELETFKKSISTQGFNFIELVPDTKDPLWFKKACDSGIQCDVLLISGHFGGLFFGEGTSQTIGIAEMEQASCRNTCPGILQNPREVYLMGCNTLATQTKDHRTIDQYLNVLIEDGIPLDFAEQVAASRYTQQGFSLEKRFSAIFNNSKKLYGFSSTGPLGASAAPLLRRYLNDIGSYDSHLKYLSDAPNAALQREFKDTNYRETIPTKALDAGSRQLFCQLRSEDSKTQTQALRTIVSDKKVTGFFDSLASQVSQIKASLTDLLDPSTKNSLSQSLNKIAADNRNLITIQHEVLQVSSSLGLIDNTTKLRRVTQLLDQAYSQDLNYSKISQICGILKQEPDLQNLSLDKITTLSSVSPYFMLTLACYPTLNEDTKSFLFDKIMNPQQPYERTIALQVMKGHWSQQDMGWISGALGTRDQNLRMRLYLSARDLLKPYRASLLAGSNLAACILKSENEGAKELGTNWGCLTENQSDLTVDICDHFANLNDDPENADDMRWYCWSNNKTRLLNQRPECYALASTMGIRGNQMKQVWNCSHG